MPDSQSTVPDTVFGLPLSRAVQEPVIGNRAPGASGTGDMLGANNLSDVASAATALANIGGASTASVTAAQAAAIAAAATDATTKANAAQAAAIAASQPLDSDLTTIAAANNGAVLAATTASFLSADRTKLDGISAGATVTNSTTVNAAGAVMESDYDANTILVATADNTPLPVTIAASRFVARKATGDIGATTGAEAAAILAGEVFKQAQEINAQTGTTYTLVAGDAGKLVTLSNASAITLSVPQDSAATIAIGTYVELFQLGAGQVTVAAGTGATLRTGGLTSKARAQYSSFGVQKISANTWRLYGDLAAT